MRIISGRFKGRRLVSFSADHIRPTTDRVKESIFNKLQGHVEGSRVLDLFSGTGNLAIECLSRGASSVDAVEKNSKSIKIIKQNIQLLAIDQGLNIMSADVMVYIKNYQGAPYDLILIDPPFTQKLSHLVLTHLSSSKTVGEETLVVIESASGEVVESSYGRLNLLDQKSFGDKKVTYFKKLIE